MDVMDIASSAIQKITSAYGEKIRKTVTADPIPEAEPVVMTGDGFRVGFAREEIMPDLKLKRTYWIAGHGSGHKMQGILTKVYAHAMWIGCGDGGIMWLSLDCIGLTRIEADIIRDSILENPIIEGCRAVNVSVTHSHSGVDTLGYWGKANAVGIPSDGKVPEYMEMLFAKCLAAAENAYRSACSGKLYFGVAPIPGGLFTKRKFVDKHEFLTRLRFAPDDGSDETWLVNVGAHPNSLGGGNRLLSGEYPYYFREYVKRETGANVLFTVGAIGGMDAAQLDEKNKINCIRLQGRFYADAAEKLTDERELKPDIRVLRQEFYMPVSNNVLALLAIRGTMSFRAYPSDDSETGIATKTEITLVRIDGANLLCLPGESFVSTVFGGYNDEESSTNGRSPEDNPEPLSEIVGDDRLVVFANTNDMTGYVVPPNDWVLNPTQPYLNTFPDRFGDGHYHETNSMGPRSQQYIADAFAIAVRNIGK